MSSNTVQAIEELAQDLLAADYVAGANARLEEYATLFLVKILVLIIFFGILTIFNQKIKALVGTTGFYVLLLAVPIWAQLFYDCRRYDLLVSTHPDSFVWALFENRINSFIQLVLAIWVLTVVLKTWAVAAEQDRQPQSKVKRAGKILIRSLVGLIPACFIVGLLINQTTEKAFFQKSAVVATLSEGRQREAVEEMLGAVGLSGIKLYQSSEKTVGARSNYAAGRVTLTEGSLAKFDLEQLKGVALHESYHLKIEPDQARFFYLIVIPLVSAVLIWWAIKINRRGEHLAERLSQHFKLQKWLTMAPLTADFSLATLLVVVCWVPYLTIDNLLARKHEAEADRFAAAQMAELNLKPLAFAQALATLSSSNQNSPQPPPLYQWIFNDHPDTVERLREIAKFVSENQLDDRPKK